MKHYGHLLLPPFALILQLAPPAFIWLIARLTYQMPAHMTETSAWPLSLIGLACWAATGLLLGGASVYLLLTRARLRTAIPLIVLCGIPSLIGGSVYLLSIFVFLAVL